MKKPFSSTLVLTGAFCVVLAWYMVWEKNLRPDREKKKDEAKELIQMDAADVQEILVEREKLPAPGATPGKVDYETLRFKKVSGNWSIVEPIPDPGDEGSISNLASVATSQKYDDIIQEGVKDFKPYGLESAKIRITVFKDQNTKASLWVGNDTPVGYATYVRKADSTTLYQTSKALRTAFERKLDEFREKKIVDWLRADVAEVEIRGTAGETLVKRPSGASTSTSASAPNDNWVLARQDIPADTSEWNKSLNAVLELRATDFASESAKDAAKFGLSHPHLTIQLTKQDGKTRFRLAIGKVKDKFYVKREDRETIFEVGKDAVAPLDRPSTALVDKTVARFNRFQTKRVRIEHLAGIGGSKRESVELAKVGPDWTFANDPTAKVSNQKVDAFLTTLQDVRLTEYSSETPKKAAMKIIVFEEESGKASEKETVSLTFAPSGTSVIGSRTGLSRAFKIKMTDFNPINLGRAEFVEPPKKTSENTEAKEADKKPNS